jgi:hypothetical protein
LLVIGFGIIIRFGVAHSFNSLEEAWN